MGHNCKNIQHGQKVCAEHLLARTGVQYRFRKMLEDILSYEEIAGWHELTTASMLPADKSKPLDDCSQNFIDRISKGEVAN